MQQQQQKRQERTSLQLNLFAAAAAPNPAARHTVHAHCCCCIAKNRAENTKSPSGSHAKSLSARSGALGARQVDVIEARGRARGMPTAAFAPIRAGLRARVASQPSCGLRSPRRLELVHWRRSRNSVPRSTHQSTPASH